MSNIVKARGSTIRAAYPCCGKPCTLRVVMEHGQPLRREVVQRTHYCEPGDEVGTAWRIEWAIICRTTKSVAYRVEFQDLADYEAEKLYGIKVVPRRTVD